MEFNTFKISDIADVQTGPFGSQLHKEDYVLVGTPIITVEHLGENKIIHSNLPKVKREDWQRLSKYVLKENDIVFSRVGSVDRCALVSETENDWLFSGRCLRVRVKDTTKVDPKYLSYYFSSNKFKSYIRSIAVGATMPSINTKILSEIKVELPDIFSQKKTAKFLHQLDSKIWCNEKIINNLDQLSQTLFKQWFIDFEFPNEEGKPYKSSGGEMVESVMGKIPINWSISKIETIAQFKNGKKITSDDRNETGIYKIFGSNGVIGYTNKTLYSAPSLVIGRVGANCGSMELSLDPCWISDNAIICAPKNMIYYNFLYILLKKIKLKERAGGSAQPLINQSILKGLKFILPSESLMKKFHSIAYKNTQLIENLKKENEKLAEIRDTLLPKLLSGEIEIPDELEV